MRLILLLLFIAKGLNSTSQPVQNSTTSADHGRRIIKADSIKTFVDSLKHNILKDTSRFASSDLYNINGVTKNKHPYSILFNINWKCYYRMDIINGVLVNEFVSKILDTSLIKHIEVLSKTFSITLWGSDGIDGCILILTEHKRRNFYKIAGLKYYKKRKEGSNLDQRKKGEVMIRT